MTQVFLLAVIATLGVGGVWLARSGGRVDRSGADETSSDTDLESGELLFEGGTFSRAYDDAHCAVPKARGE